MGVKISKDLIENRVKDIFPNYIFDFTDYKNTHSKIDFICDKNHKKQDFLYRYLFFDHPPELRFRLNGLKQKKLILMP